MNRTSKVIQGLKVIRRYLQSPVVIEVSQDKIDHNLERLRRAGSSSLTTGKRQQILNGLSRENDDRYKDCIPTSQSLDSLRRPYVYKK